MRINFLTLKNSAALDRYDVATEDFAAGGDLTIFKGRLAALGIPAAIIARHTRKRGFRMVCICQT